MSTIGIDVEPHSDNLKTMYKSVERMESQHNEAKEDPSLFNQVMAGLAIFAAAGTMLNASLEIAEMFQKK